MRIAPDGSPVDLYSRLSEGAGDAALIHSLLPPGDDVLDLGCGTGGLSEPLVRLGHPVTGELAAAAGLVLDRSLTEDRTLVLLRPA